MFGRNVDKAKVEVIIRVEDFLVKPFEKFYVTIWSCMKLEDVLEVFPMLMLKIFVDWFVFIWGHEQCSKTIGQISPRSHYYLKDLKPPLVGLPLAKTIQAHYDFMVKYFKFQLSSSSKNCYCFLSIWVVMMVMFIMSCLL